MGDDSTAAFSFSESSGPFVDGDVDDPFPDVEGFRVESLEAFDDDGPHLVQWDTDVDRFFRLLADHDGRVRRGTGTDDAWTFETWFPGHEAFATFRAAAEDAGSVVDVTRIYNPTSTGTGAWYGLTPRQRRTLELAVERGYYDIPRRCTTIELADELGISDQAVTERLRRGIMTFVTNALLMEDE